MSLDATALANAVRRLREGLARCNGEPNDEQLRDGLIQRFEFTYELCHKTLRRYLRETAASPEEFERAPFADLIRTGNAHGLLRAEWPAWRRFREMRGQHQPSLRCRDSVGGSRGDTGISRRGRASLRRPAAAPMTGSAHADLPADHWRLVLVILGAHLPSGAQAWVFGSRATGRAQPYSDLDLAIDAGRPLTLDERARLAEAFRDCDLPYRVDLVDWRSIEDRFRKLIATQRIPLFDRAVVAERGDGG
jgi:predicted nucleotidyltransferase